MIYWKNTWASGEAYPSCQEILLNEGMIVSHVFDWPVQYISQAVYQQNCYQSSIPVFNTNVGLVIEKFSEPLPVVASSWEDYTQNNSRGSFSYSVVSIVYAISVSAVITWFLTIFVLTNYTIKPSWLLKGSTLLSSVYILLVVIKSIITLHEQQREGYLHGAKLLNDVNRNNAVNIMDLIVVFLLQINQVQIIMRLFQRQKDKRLTFYIGIIATLMSQIIWSISSFHTFATENEAGDILPAFIYLVRIAMALCYAAIITVYFISKIKLIIANRRIWLLTLLTLILIYSPVAFFIADVSNAFIYELSEIFSVVNYVIGVVIPWEWCNKFNLIMKAKEKEGVLGRRFYEDESYELDRFELFVEEQAPSDENDDDDDNENNENNDNNNGNQHEGPSRGVGNTDDANPHNTARRDDAGVERPRSGGRRSAQRLSNSQSKSPHSQEKTAKEPNLSQKVLNAIHVSKHKFISLTDHIIAAGFAIPRSVSVPSNSSGPQTNEQLLQRQEPRQLEPEASNINKKNSYTTHMFNTNSGTGSSETNTVSNSNRRRNIYMYARKEVILDVSSDDEHE
ncbi:uncharacterized protein LODBEIA_P56620 [Lodderomyces beijingensis]|uniref:pH-response regulator protein palH/RIM21 n=1 Tax=Lodderomyces beijingensis TaxID=1775926 RepID=A0ABP0ZTH8_9ASCO